MCYIHYLWLNLISLPGGPDSPLGPGNPLYPVSPIENKLFITITFKNKYINYLFVRQRQEVRVRLEKSILKILYYGFIYVYYLVTH
jgi:hypothetical protein